MCSSPKNDEHGESKYNFLPEFRNSENISEGCEHLDHLYFSAGSNNFFFSRFAETIA